MKLLPTFVGLACGGRVFARSPYMVILGPYHRVHRADEGWVSRVRAIDLALSGYHRVYVNFSVEGKLFIKGSRGAVYSDDPWVVQYNLDDLNLAHMDFFARLLEGAFACYAHNLHLAEHALRFCPPHKLIVDLHGAVPEEELLLGDKARAARFAAVERKLLDAPNRLVVVSRALRRHLILKYPETKAQFIHIPIREPLPICRPRVVTASPCPLFVYCGSNHLWQNVPAVLDVARRYKGLARFSIYSHQYQSIRDLAQATGGCEQVTFGFAHKDELPSVYSRADFGFLLRDDNVVNRVACPTKLYEYLHFGVIPVLRSPSIGDFKEYGYRYLQESELSPELIANAVSDPAFSSANRAAAAALDADFVSGCEILKNSLNQTF